MGVAHAFEIRWWLQSHLNITEVPCTGPTTFHTTDAKQSFSIDIISIVVGYISESTGLSTWEKKILQGNALPFSCMHLKCMKVYSQIDTLCSSNRQHTSGHSRKFPLLCPHGVIVWTPRIISAWHTFKPRTTGAQWELFFQASQIFCPIE